MNKITMGGNVPLTREQMKSGLNAMYGCIAHDTEYMRQILTHTQYKYYVDYCYNGMLLSDISIKYDVDVSTVCRVIKNARARLLSYFENGGNKNENGQKV